MLLVLAGIAYLVCAVAFYAVLARTAVEIPEPVVLSLIEGGQQEERLAA